jgi:WD40 repeat protein
VVDIGGTDCSVMAVCSFVKGQIQTTTISLDNKIVSSNIIAAHSSKISCIAVSSDGDLVSTASVKGTLVRVFSVKTGQLLHELRRGSDSANIYSIAFSFDTTKLCVSSEKGTIHVFLLYSTGPTGNRQSIFQNVKYLPKYFSSDWSFAHVNIPSNERCCVSFYPNEPSKIMALTADGGFYVFRVDLDNGGEGDLLLFKNFITMDFV